MDLVTPSLTTRQIRAWYDDTTITVYQAFSDEIASAALKAGTFVAPFKRERMTWVKPSFLWMMYRSGWATKPGQERVLAVDITRAGFEWALDHSCLSSFDPAVYASHDTWEAAKLRSPVRVQWDPERDLRLRPLDARTIQVGLSGEAVQRYVDEWVVTIHDITALVLKVSAHLAGGDERAALQLLPPEQPYPLSEKLRSVVGTQATT